MKQRIRYIAEQKDKKIMRIFDILPATLLAEFSTQEHERLKHLTCTGISSDTRSLTKGDFYIGGDGHQSTGAAFLSQAFEKGACGALISQKGAQTLKTESLKILSESFPIWISKENPQSIIGLIASRMYPHVPEMVMAVTGTNGKTSVSFFAYQMMEKLGFPAAFLGTIGLWVRGEKMLWSELEACSLTSPDAITLHKTLSKLSQAGIQAVSLEASSHGLDQGRLKGIHVKAAGFTNFSQDHLDYHETMERYFEAKCRLFGDILERQGWAVLNADSEEYPLLHTITQKRAHRLFSYGWEGRDLRLLALTPFEEFLELEVDFWGERATLPLPLIGDYQVHNVLCALGLVAGSLGLMPTDKKMIQRCLETVKTLKSPPGRLEFVGKTPTKARIYVDYAHTPDAFERVLDTLRPFTKGDLWILFGCGGDRDREKRPLMGKIAYEKADYCVITDDNPRFEDPDIIRAQIQMHIPMPSSRVFVSPNREEAIDQTLEKLKEGDVLLLAGKGHEQGQIMRDRIEPFNDKTITLSLLHKMRKRFV